MATETDKAQTENNALQSSLRSRRNSFVEIAQAARKMETAKTTTKPIARFSLKKEAVKKRKDEDGESCVPKFFVYW